MLNAILFTIVFLWLFALSARQATVSEWFETLQEERAKILDFIDVVKARWASDSTTDSGGGP